MIGFQSARHRVGSKIPWIALCGCTLNLHRKWAHPSSRSRIHLKCLDQGLEDVVRKAPVVGHWCLPKRRIAAAQINCHQYHFKLNTNQKHATINSYRSNRNCNSKLQDLKCFEIFSGVECIVRSFSHLVLHFNLVAEHEQNICWSIKWQVSIAQWRICRICMWRVTAEKKTDSQRGPSVFEKNRITLQCVLCLFGQMYDLINYNWDKVIRMMWPLSNIFHFFGVHPFHHLS